MQRSMFIPIGLLLCGVAQIIMHYVEVPDFASGLSMGVGIGIMALGFIKPQRGSAC